VKQELPKLRQDLEDALIKSKDALNLMGQRRSTPSDCKAYLAQLSLDHYEICKAPINGHYEGEYFHKTTDYEFSLQSPSTISRLRAVVQFLNTEFTANMFQKGYKYDISSSTDDSSESSELNCSSEDPIMLMKQPFDPIKCAPQLMDWENALQWVRRVLVRTRGKELLGNFNPLLIGELFWEQSSRWRLFATHHIEQVVVMCQQFLQNLLETTAPKDVKSRIWASRIIPALQSRRQAAYDELDNLIEDAMNFPINYDQYYTDTISKQRQDKQKNIYGMFRGQNREHYSGSSTCLDISIYRR
jgi:hypothetical protein